MANRGTWTTEGFEDFRQGTFGNAGQNIYVSRAGVLQRIHHQDLNGDGYADLLYCNSQDHWERPPCYVYLDPLQDESRLELPSDGSVAGTLADLNGDGYDDLILAMDYNGSRQDLNAFVYYGGPEGLGERARLELPAPIATAVACADFNADGRPDLAFVCAGKLRVFYQSELGFEPLRFQDLDIAATQLAAADLDGDGAGDLYVLRASGEAVIYWGGPEGLQPASHTVVRPAVPAAPGPSADGPAIPVTEAVLAISPLAKVIIWGGTPHLFLPGPESFSFRPVLPDRSLGAGLTLACPQAVSVAAGDLSGDGYLDLVVAARGVTDGQQHSWVYWGNPGGLDPGRRTALPTHGACDLALGDLTGSGHDDIVICQDRTADSFDFHALVYRGAALTRTAEDPATVAEPIRLESHEARCCLIGRTMPRERPQVILINHRARRSGGDIDPMIYYGGTEGFSPERGRPLRGRDAVDAVCCDLRDRGRPDIVTANCSENAIELDPGSFIFNGCPEGYAYEPDAVLPTTRAHGVCCADLNHNGYLDLVFVGFNFPEILIFTGGPDGYDPDQPQRINMQVEGEKWNEPRWIYLADLSNNGYLDLFVPQIASDRSFILWNGPEGFSMDRRQVLPAIHASCAQAADLTGNGYLDLVIGGHTPSPVGPHDSFVYVYWNGPDGLRADRRTQLPANGVNALAIADFNHNGQLDIFVANYHDGRVRDTDSYIYWGMAGGRFSAENRERLFMHSASGAVAADFNEDGWVDLAVAYHKVNNDHRGYSAIWWNGPESFSDQRITTLPSLGPHGMTRVGTGNQADRGPEEYYLSAPYQLPAEATMDRIEWEAETPGRTWVRAQLRVAASSEELGGAPWMGPEGEGSWYDGAQSDGPRLAGQWVQYRLALGAPNGCGTPRVRRVKVTWA